MYKAVLLFASALIAVITGCRGKVICPGGKSTSPAAYAADPATGCTSRWDVWIQEAGFSRTGQKTLYWPVVAQSGGRLYFKDGNGRICSTDLNGDNPEEILLRNESGLYFSMADTVYAYGGSLYYSASYYMGPPEDQEIRFCLFKHDLAQRGEDKRVIEDAETIMGAQCPEHVWFKKQDTEYVYDLASGLISGYVPRYPTLVNGEDLRWASDETDLYYLCNSDAQDRILVIKKEDMRVIRSVLCGDLDDADAVWGMNDELIRFSAEELTICQYCWKEDKWETIGGMDPGMAMCFSVPYASILYRGSIYFAVLNNEYSNPLNPDESEFLLWKFDIAARQGKLVRYHSTDAIDTEICGPTYFAVAGNVLFAYETSEYGRAGFYMKCRLDIFE